MPTPAHRKFLFKTIRADDYDYWVDFAGAFFARGKVQDRVELRVGDRGNFTYSSPYARV